MSELELFETVCAELERGVRVALACVMATDGSMPRGAGAHMAVLRDGSSFGSVGGGALERIVSRRATAALGTGISERMPYDEGTTGMVCGGTALVGIHVLGAGDVPAVRRLVGLLRDRRQGWMVVDWSGPKPILSVLEAGDASAEPYGRLARPLYEGDLYVEPVARDGRLYVFGAGHVGCALTGLLADLEFDVTVADDREAFAKRELVPAAREVLLVDYADITSKVSITPRDYVVVMTHGHMGDIDVVASALSEHPIYVGCMGSARKRQVLEATLVERGLTPSQVASVHLPIGMDIHAVTPAEIAISVAAELIQVRAEAREGRR